MFVSRIPRSLDDEMCHWKSSEYRNFLLYWGLPILREVLDKDHFTHFCLLARSTFLLSKEGITAEELATAEMALFLFVEHMKVLYGERYLTLNIHQLVHLSDCVRTTGPLYVHNCFVFEDLNGFMVKQIHGTHGVDPRLTEIIAMMKVPAVLYELYMKETEDEETKEIYNELTDSIAARYKNLEEIEDGIRPLGIAHERAIKEHEKILALALGVKNTVVGEFNMINMYKKRFYVYGKAYCRLEKRQQSVVTYLKGNENCFGCVNSFIQPEEKHPDQVINLDVVSPFTKIQPLGCVWEVRPENEMELIPIRNILNVNNFLEVNNISYVCPSPNRYDRD